MPSLTSTGLVIDTVAALQTQFTLDMQNIYGQNINLASDTPDGQMMMNFIESSIATQEVTLQSFNSFDPDNAVGTVLDQRCAVNGIQRQQGTFTTTNVKITFGATGTLYGLDQTAQPVFTVTDNAGTMQWQLVTTVTKTVGSYELVFRAAVTGAVLTIPGTITVPVTVVLAVTAINNDQAYLSLGVAQESDNQFKIRRQQSTSIGSQGYYNGLVADLQNISGIGVGNVKVYENDTAGTVNSIPSHSIWVVVGGGVASQSTIGGVAGANAQAIATAIYNKRNAGCGMYSTTDSFGQSYAVTQADGSLFPIFWDTVAQIPVFINFTVGSINGVNFPNIAAIVNASTGLPSTFLPGINQTLNVNMLVNLVQAIDPNTYISSAGFSLTAGSFTSTLTPAAGNDQFQVTAPKIIITPMVLTSPTSVVTLSAGIPISFTVADNAVHSGAALIFTALGGYTGIGYTFSILTNNSGATFVATYTFTVTAANATVGATYTNNSNTYTVVGTISGGTTLIMTGTSYPLTSGTLTKASGTGDATIAFSSCVLPISATYTPGVTGSVTDTIKVQDSLSNNAVASVVVA